MSEDSPKCRAPGGMKEDYIFEQVQSPEGNHFVFFDKKTRTVLANAPIAYTNYVPLDDCPWKLATEPIAYDKKETLWNGIKTFLIEHVFLPDERLYDVLTAWVLCTWIPEKWDSVPYLIITGPMSSGKTRLLETLEAICYRGIFSANMTSAALFRTLELHRPTLFLDETEIYRKEEYSDVAHLLNAGYRRGQKAWRVEHDFDGQPTIRGFDVFGFKALAGTQELVSTLQSRSIIIDMVKNIQQLNFKINDKKALGLRNQLLYWRLRELCEDSEDSDGVYPLLQSLGDGRLIELFYCLISVSNSGRESILDYANTMKENREAEQQTTLQFQVLDAMVQLKDKVVDGKLLAKDVTEKLNEGLEPNEKFTARYILRLLAELGFKKTHLRNGNGIMWNEKMLEYRLRQYRLIIDATTTKDSVLEGYTPPESSLSSQSSHCLKSELLGFTSLVQLAIHTEDKCANCGITGKMDWQVTYPDDKWALLCESCGRLARKTTEAN